MDSKVLYAIAPGFRHLELVYSALCSGPRDRKASISILTKLLGTHFANTYEKSLKLHAAYVSG
jgi:hypothetical protein